MPNSKEKEQLNWNKTRKFISKSCTRLISLRQRLTLASCVNKFIVYLIVINLFVVYKKNKFALFVCCFLCISNLRITNQRQFWYYIAWNQPQLSGLSVKSKKNPLTIWWFPLWSVISVRTQWPCISHMMEHTRILWIW